MKYKIIDMHPDDAHYPNKDDYIGTIIEPTSNEDCTYKNLGKEGWKFVHTPKNCFLAIKLKAVRKYTKKVKTNG